MVARVNFLNKAHHIVSSCLKMPPKNKRKLHLAKAREAKRHKSLQSDQTPEDTSEESLIANQIHQEAMPEIPEDTALFGEPTEASSEIENEQSTPDTEANEEEMMKLHIQDWIAAMSRDDIMSLSITLHYMLVTLHGVMPMKAADSIASLVGKTERTVREWRYMFFSSNGEFPDSEQGKYQRQGVLSQNEELNEAARDYVRANAVVKGRPNLTSRSFCQWVNESLLPNSILDPGYPRKVSVQTARKWLHDLGFMVLNKKKGVYIDGHERDDVVKH